MFLFIETNRRIVNRLGEISRVLGGIEDPRLIRGFLKSILTEKEIRDISSRWELVKLLESGMSQRTIARRLGLSLCKITRGSRELKKRNSPLKRVIGRL